uniref:Uncharacterized protein n=1 Tax=Oryza punctata TaxID=4537 RepID=A0A0E0LYP8_ORYPU
MYSNTVDPEEREVATVFKMAMGSQSDGASGREPSAREAGGAVSRSARAGEEGSGVRMKAGGGRGRRTTGAHHRVSGFHRHHCKDMEDAAPSSWKRYRRCYLDAAATINEHIQNQIKSRGTSPPAWATKLGAAAAAATELLL